MEFSAASGLQPSEQAIQLKHDSLGYPVYFIQFISIAKLPGAIIILIPGPGRDRFNRYLPGVDSMGEMKVNTKDNFCFSAAIRKLC
jgi:hypothetical protein